MELNFLVSHNPPNCHHRGILAVDYGICSTRVNSADSFDSADLPLFHSTAGANRGKFLSPYMGIAIFRHIQHCHLGNGLLVAYLQ